MDSADTWTHPQLRAVSRWQTGAPTPEILPNFPSSLGEPPGPKGVSPNGTVGVGLVEGLGKKSPLSSATGERWYPFRRGWTLVGVHQGTGVCGASSCPQAVGFTERRFLSPNSVSVNPEPRDHSLVNRGISRGPGL